MNKKSGFIHWQWKMIITAMTGYALFYLVRKNFSLAMPSLNSEFGITKTQLGIFLTFNGIVYGLSRFVVGILTDKGSARKIMSLGLFLTALVNIIFGCSDYLTSLIFGWIPGDPKFTSSLILFMGVFWTINGFLQGMGVPPCTKVMTQWIHPSELATKMSFWNMSHSIGAALAIGLCGWFILPILGSWRWCFIIPGSISMLGSVFLFFNLRDSPTDAGFPAIEGLNNIKITTPEEAAEHKAFVRKHVYGNRIIWTLGVANFFIYIIRFAALDWGPTLLTESKAVTLAAATTLCVLFEFVGGNLGMLFWGWATDRWFSNKAHHTCVFCMVCAALCILMFWFVPPTAPWWLNLVPFTLIGFCIYGPNALLGISAAQHATNKASATANGILGIFGYASTLVSGFGFGYVAQHYGWDMAYVTIFVMAILSVLTLLTIWKANATGYDEQPFAIVEQSTAPDE